MGTHVVETKCTVTHESDGSEFRFMHYRFHFPDDEALASAGDELADMVQFDMKHQHGKEDSDKFDLLLEVSIDGGPPPAPLVPQLKVPSVSLTALEKIGKEWGRKLGKIDDKQASKRRGVGGGKGRKP